jgi:hypothetical protein
MLSHDKKVSQKKGEKPHGYVPRPAHPLLKPKSDENGEQNKDGKTGGDQNSAMTPSSEVGQ